MINQSSKKDNSNSDTQAVNWQILLVEDNNINQEVAKDMLIQMGCDVHIAINGLEAVAVIEQKKFDLILMDCNMPELDGYTATRKIRELERQQKKPNIPILAFTTDAMPDIRERCFEAGMDDFLTKPLVFNDLQRMLKIWLESQSIEVEKPVEINNKPHATNNSIDLKVLNEMRQHLHADQATWLIELYLRELPTYLTTIHDAITLQEGENLYLTAHKFKGASAILGAHRVVAVCKMLETLGRNQTFTETTELFATLQKECSYLEGALKMQN